MHFHSASFTSTIATTTSFFGRSQYFPLSSVLSVTVVHGGLENGGNALVIPCGFLYHVARIACTHECRRNSLNSSESRTAAGRDLTSNGPGLGNLFIRASLKSTCEIFSSPLPLPLPRLPHRRGPTPCLHSCCLGQSLTYVHRHS